MVPPLSPEDDAIPNAGAGSASRIDHVFLLKRGEPANRELTLDEGVAQLLNHTDLAYGFPSGSPLAADGYAELLQREGVLLWEALQRSSMREVLIPGRGEADILPRLVQAPLPARTDATANTAALTPLAPAWGPLVAMPSTVTPTPAEPTNRDAPSAPKQRATKSSTGEKKAPRAASRTAAASSRKRTTKAAAAVGSKAPGSSRFPLYRTIRAEAEGNEVFHGREEGTARSVSDRCRLVPEEDPKAAAAVGSKAPGSFTLPLYRTIRAEAEGNEVFHGREEGTARSVSDRCRLVPEEDHQGRCRCRLEGAAILRHGTQRCSRRGRGRGPSRASCRWPWGRTAAGAGSRSRCGARGPHGGAGNDRASPRHERRRTPNTRPRPFPAVRWPSWACGRPADGERGERRTCVRCRPSAVITMLLLGPTLASSDAHGGASVESGVEAASGGSRAEPLHVQDAFDGLREGSPVVGWAVSGGTPAVTAVTAFPNAGDRSLRVQLRKRVEPSASARREDSWSRWQSRWISWSGEVVPPPASRSSCHQARGRSSKRARHWVAGSLFVQGRPRTASIAASIRRSGLVAPSTRRPGLSAG